MNIIYADDDQLSLEIVGRAFQARGHHVQIINTSRATEMLNQLKLALKNKADLHVVILDGHNVALDAQGKAVADVAPTTLVDWLRKQGMPSDTRLVLYSSDENLVDEIRTDLKLGFSAAIRKGGSGGGLRALLEAVETTV